MPDSKRFLHPEAIKRISRLEMRARHIVEGLSRRACTAARTSANRSSSCSTASTSPATTCATSTGRSGPGRTDSTSSSSRKRPTSAARCWSMSRNSMAYGSGPLNKYEYACTIACSLAYLLLRQQDAVGCVAFDEKVRGHGADAHEAQPHFQHRRFARRPGAARQDRHVRRSCAASPKRLRGAA